MERAPSCDGALFVSAVVLVLLILVVVLVLVAVLVLVTVLVVVLVLILVVHLHFLRNSLFHGFAAKVVCPAGQDLSFALNRNAAVNPATMAAVMPPALLFRPPVKIPRKPLLSTASRTPFAMV